MSEYNKNENISLRQQFSSSLRSTFNLLFLFILFSSIAGAFYIANDLRKNERERSLLTFSRSLEPVVARFDIADIDKTLKGVAVSNGLYHIRLVDAFGGYHEPTPPPNLKAQCDLVIPLSSNTEPNLGKVKIWWGTDPNFVPLFLKIFTLLMVSGVAILSAIWFSLQSMLSTKILDPIHSLYKRISRIRALDKIEKLPNLGSLELNELEDSFNKSWSEIKGYASERNQALERERLISAMVKSAFDVAGISIYFDLNGKNQPTLIGTATPKSLQSVWNRRDLPLSHLLDAMNHDGIKCQMVKTAVPDIRDDFDGTLRLFSLEIDENEHGIWNLYGIKLGKSGFAIISVDISDQTEMERKRGQSHKMEALGVIVSGVAHDVNNVLTTISTALELELIHDESSKNVRKALHACQRGSVLVRELLHLSREKKQRMAVIDQRNALRDLINFLPATLGPKYDLQIKVKTDLAILADGDLLETTLINFIINARDAMPDGGVINLISRVATTEEISQTNLDTTNLFVAFDIVDTGHGIPAEIKDKIFDPFFTTKPIGEGTGLGLSLAFNFVSRAGGDIAIKDNKPHSLGTTFTIYLPAKTRKPIRLDEGKIDHLSRHHFGDFLRVLLVEDEIDLLDSVREYFDIKGIEHTCASSFQQAASILNQNKTVPFNVLIVDMLMPDGTGIDVLKLRSKMEGGYYGVITSGNLITDNLSDSDKALFNEFLQKPYQFRQFDEVISHATRHLDANESVENG